jgi:chemotaxis protein methyltransferase CheR
MIDFQRFNLNHESEVGEGPFDIILCRNVLIYFDVASKQRVIANLRRHLTALGLLLVGHAENLNGICSQLRCIEPSIYTMTGQTEGLLGLGRKTTS